MQKLWAKLITNLQQFAFSSITQWTNLEGSQSCTQGSSRSNPFTLCFSNIKCIEVRSIEKLPCYFLYIIFFLQKSKKIKYHHSFLLIKIEGLDFSQLDGNILINVLITVGVMVKTKQLGCWQAYLKVMGSNPPKLHFFYFYSLVIFCFVTQLLMSLIMSSKKGHT